jgi:TrkA domain protein
MTLQGLSVFHSTLASSRSSEAPTTRPAAASTRYRGLVRVRVEQTALPGIGVRHDLITSAGRTVGVVSHRNGRRDLVVYDVDDPDSCVAAIPLTDDEAEALGDVLGASLMLGQLAGLRSQAAGLVTEQVAIPAGSPYVGRRMGDTRARTRTGASIVAVLRDREVIASPGPSFVFDAGDVVVVVGTRKGIDGVTAILANGDTD